MKTPVRVDVPIRIRVDAVALSGQAGELDDALAAATGRALGTASRVLADAGPAGRVEVGAPVLTWTGDGLDQVDAFTRAAAAQRVRRVVADAVDGAGVRRGRRRVATGDPPPVDDPAKVERALRGADAKAAAQAVKAIQRQVQAGDATAFRLALGGLRPDGAYPTAVLLELLRGLAGRHPDRFRALLRPYLTAASSATLRRDPNDLVVDVGLRDDPATALRGAAERLAAAVPAGERLRRELDAALPGLDRVEGLLQAVADRYLDLVAFLRAGVEPTRTDARAKLADLLAGTSRRAGVLVALRRDPRLRKLLPDLEADLREVLRWLSATLDRLRVVDEYLAAYRRMFGLGADRQEEVQVLREVREVLLGQVAGNPLPDRNVLVTLRQQADEAWADWQGRATDRRILRLRLTLADLRAANRELAEYNPYFDQPPLPSSRLDPGASFAGDLRVPFAIRLRETRQTLADAESALWAQEPRRDLFGLILLEQQLVLASVRVQLLALWQRTLALQTNFMFPHDLGSRTDQAGWTREFGALREALATAYAKPDFDHLGSQLAQWNGTLEWLTKDMQRVHRQEAIVGILIDVGAMLAAVGAAKVFGGSAAFSIGRVTLIEAGTFTLASGLGQAIFLGKAPDPSRMVNQLLENFALFGAFKLLGHVVGSAASRTLRKLVGPTLVGEFVAVVGANTALGIGLSALVAKVQSGEWPESWLLLVAGTVLVGAVGAALATPELLRAIRLEGAIGQQLARELTSLHGASSAWTDAVGDAVRLGDLEARWPWLRKEGIRMTRQEIEVWSELARLSNSTLRSLGIAERGQIAQEVTSLRRYLRLLEGMEAVRLPRRLPAPTQLVPTARPSGPGAFEYDPAAVSSSAAAGRLKAAGYTVTDLGGGVLRLTGAGVQGAGVHLLPAGRRPLALPAGRQPLALPAGAAPSDAELAVFAAAEPLSPSDVRRAVAPAHDPGQWTALARAARLDPHLVWRAIQAPPDALGARLDELVEALRAADLSWDQIAKARAGADTLNGARRAAQAYSPAPGILAAVGPGASGAVEQVLGTPDGRALLAAAQREPARTRTAILAPDQILQTAMGNLAAELRSRGLSESEISAVRRGIEAVRLARQAATVDPAELLLDAAGRQVSARSLVDGLSTAPQGRAILDLVRRRPELARRAVAATAQENAEKHLDRLVALAKSGGWSEADLAELRRVVTTLNLIANRAGMARVEAGRLAWVVTQLGEEQAFLTTAGEVLRGFTGRRRARAVAWLQTPNRAATETATLAAAVRTSPDLGRMNPITLRELWTRYRAPRSRPLRSPDFASYVDVLSRHGRGQLSEWTATFWVSDRYLILVWPDATVTAGGTDLALVPRGGGTTLYVDVKNLAADEVQAVTALTRNFPRNLTKDVAGWNQVQALANPGLPSELLDAANRRRAAEAAIRAITRGLGKDQIDTVAVQQRITAALAQPHIDIQRGVLVAGGNVQRVSQDLARRGLVLLNPRVAQEVRGTLLQAGGRAATVDLAAEIDGNE